MPTPVVELQDVRKIYQLGDSGAGVPCTCGLAVPSTPSVLEKSRTSESTMVSNSESPRTAAEARIETTEGDPR